MSGTPLDELDNMYTDLKKEVSDVDTSINELKSTPGINAEAESKKILQKINLIKSQRQLYAEHLRAYIQKKDDAGTKIMTPEDVIEYKKKSRKSSRRRSGSGMSSKSPYRAD